MFGLTFGIEVEFTGLDKQKLHALLLSRYPELFIPPGDPRIDFTDHNSRLRLAFTDQPLDKTYGIKSDGSVTSPGGEFVTPILMEQDIPSFKRFLDMVRSFSCVHCDFSCGLHVHVGQALGIPQDSQEVVMFYNWRTLQPRIKKAFRPNDHRNANYCSIYFNARKYGSDRRLAVNTTHTHHPTTEFRLFDGHLDFRYIMRAVRFSCTFVHLASRGILISEPPRGLSIEKHLESQCWNGIEVGPSSLSRLVQALGEERENIIKREMAREEAYWRRVNRGRGGSRAVVDEFDIPDLIPSQVREWEGADATTRVSFHPAQTSTTGLGSPYSLRPSATNNTGGF